MHAPAAGIANDSRRHSRIAIAVFAALLIVSLAVGVLVFRNLVADEERTTRTTLVHVANIEAAAISSWALERLGDAGVFGSSFFLGKEVQAWVAQGAGDGPEKQKILQQLRVIKNMYGYLDIAVIGPDGNARLSTQQPFAPLNPVATETIRQALAGNTARMSSIYPSREYTEVRRVVDIATPLHDATTQDGKLTPALLLRSNADLHLEPFVQSMPLLTTSIQVVLAEIRDQRVVVTSVSENARHFGDRDVLPIEPTTLLNASLRASKQPFIIATPHDGEALAVAQKIDGVPWYLISIVDSNATHASVTGIAWSVTAAGGAILLPLGLALLMWWRQKEGAYRLNALRASMEHQLLQQQYEYLSRYANDMIELADMDGRLLAVNDTAVKMFGRKRDDLIGMQMADLFMPASRDALHKALERLKVHGAALFEVDKKRADGQAIPVEVSARAIQLDDRRFIQLICRDISERRQAESELRESRQRLDDIMHSIQDIVWSVSCDLKHVRYMNQSVERIFGYPVSAFSERPQLWFDLIFPEDRDRVMSRLHGLSAGEPLCDDEYRIIRRDGMIRWLHTRGKLVVDAGSHPLRIDGVTTDITQRKATEQQVHILAYYDNVTGLPNRRLMQDRLGQAMQMAARSEKKVALLFMDLDNFKHINDSLGHHVGDMLLQSIAHRLLQCVRAEDTVARIGGDEFLVVLPDLEKSGQAVQVADKILAATARTFVLEGQQIHSTISIGISVYPDDATEANELIQHADSALYQAKSHGRDNYQFFTSELNAQITRTSRIERDLRRAIDDDKLCLWYQPQIDSRNGRLIGAEALLRWRSDDGSFLSPLEFIPVAEERGLIGRIGEWAMREACRQCRHWQVQGLPAVPVAVNVSPIQFQQKGFAAMVTGILQETELDATLLELEITESAIMRRAPLVADLAMRLREVGVGISIDDFGTGYSSLSYLKQIPIDKIKIDRSFITDMLKDEDDNAITFAIINLAHSLNLRVIAEGVETKEQIERLQAFGCDEVQGHYYSPAVGPRAFESLLAGRMNFADIAEQAE